MLHKITKSKSQVLAIESETVKVKRRLSCGLLVVFFIAIIFFLKEKLVTKPVTPVSGEKALPSLHFSYFL